MYASIPGMGKLNATRCTVEGQFYEGENLAGRRKTKKKNRSIKCTFIFLNNFVKTHLSGSILDNYINSHLCYSYTFYDRNIISIYMIK